MDRETLLDLRAASCPSSADWPAGIRMKPWRGVGTSLDGRGGGGKREGDEAA